jgi:endo-1,4-beta-xylanase
MIRFFSAFVAVLLVLPVASAQQSADEAARKAAKKKRKKQLPPFNWASPLPEAGAKGLPKGVQHVTYTSSSMGVKVGYYVYLPPEYAKSGKRYPVVYHLHGGRPGGEYKSVKLSKFIDKAIRDGKVEPKIYVFPNGGPMSWYNYPQKELAFGEDVFIKETIPHVDKTFRTIAAREGRGIEGFSQGGRGTTRIMFKHPHLFGATAPGGSGYEPEKRIQENNGKESEHTVFAPGYNAWDLAKKYADSKSKHKLKPMIWVGDKGFNYEFNLKYMKYLETLGVPYEKLICPEVGHSASGIYEKMGNTLMQYHDRHLAKAR